MTNYKKFYRSSTDKKIAGVCGGLGEYLDIDPTIIRIIFLVALLCCGSGFLIYLVIWLAAPEM
ncbi:MAG: PspC domain-containing protein [Bacteroidales bacterium]|nr:PspC domain-containing protein [Bacteroidales bacterium]